jgi:hypothetical protein
MGKLRLWGMGARTLRLSGEPTANINVNPIAIMVVSVNAGSTKEIARCCNFDLIDNSATKIIKTVC